MKSGFITFLRGTGCNLQGSRVLAAAALMLVVLVVVVGLSAGDVEAAPGDLDPTFGNNGKVITSVGGAQDVVIQPDGKIVVAGFGGPGTESGFRLLRYNADGSLDASFGTGGKVITLFGSNGAEALAVVLQADGKIVAAGYTGGDSALARYNSDGTLDTTFDGDGKITISTAASGGRFWDVLIQSDGKIVAVGGNINFVLARYDTNGVLDPNFGNGGLVFTSINSDAAAHSAAIQADGKIIAAGSSFNSVSCFDFAIVRYNGNGSIDASFGTGGKTITDFGGCDEAFDVAIQPDGKIVAAGVGASLFALARYNTNGSLDAAFGTGGTVTTPLASGSAGAEAIAIQTNGKINVAGHVRVTGGTDQDFALVRYNPDGTLDNNFGTGGKVLTPFLFVDTANGMATQTNGKIVVAGYTQQVMDGPSSFVLARYQGDQSTRSDFDADGRADLSVRRPSDNIWYIQRGTAGYFSIEYGVPGDLMAPADYDGDGKTDVAVFRPSNGTWYIFNSASQSFQTVGWGADGDLPVPADHDADGKADLVLFRPSTNTWYTKFSNNSFSTVAFGVAGDKPVVGDFDGDGKADIGLYRPSDNNWYILKTGFGFFVQTWGEAGDIPVPADYDGDGKTDVAVFRPSTGQWFRIRSTAGFDVLNWGVSGDKPIPADYDGDGKSDVAVFRPSNATWYIVGSNSGQIIQQYGQTGDLPTEGAFIY